MNGFINVPRDREDNSSGDDFRANTRISSRDDAKISPLAPLNFSRPTGVSTIPVFRNSGLTSVPLIVDMAAGTDSLVYIRH